MNRLFSIFILACLSCNPRDKPALADQSANVAGSLEIKTNESIDSLACNKCDKKIIDRTVTRWNKLTNTEIEQFLCSLDKTCNYSETYPNSTVTYKESILQAIILELHLHLATCVRIFETNKNVDLPYILSQLQNAAGHDLPYPSIIFQLEKKKSLTMTEQKILATLKESDRQFKTKYRTDK